MLKVAWNDTTVVEYNKQRLHKVSYFRELLSANEEVPPTCLHQQAGDPVIHLHHLLHQQMPVA
jgi:hypothetical protein